VPAEFDSARWRSGNAAVCFAKRDLAPLDRTLKFMYYVYALKSLVNGDLYIGSCKDLKVRFKRHNDKKIKSTKAYAPWKLVYYEAYKDKNDASKREKQLKKHRAKLDLIKQIKNSLE